jgi:hypothetical protein
MKYYIDTEFLEGTQTKRIFGIPMLGLRWDKNDCAELYIQKTKPTIDLISIGIVAEDDREYYAISKDFNLKEAWNRWQQRTGEGDRNNIEPRLYWIRENVLKPLMQDAEYRWNFPSKPNNKFKGRFDYKDFVYIINKYGKTNKQIAEEVKQFCGLRVIGLPYSKFTNPEFYAYYADYDWVAFCWLFGKMIDLPSGFPKYCIDLKQILDEKQHHRTYMNGHKIRRGLKINPFLTIHLKNHSNYPKQTNEHNALSDARFNFKLHKFLQSFNF